MMDMSVDGVVEFFSVVIEWLALALVRSTAAIVMVTLGLTFGFLYCLAVFLLTGRLPWMVRKFL